MGIKRKIIITIVALVAVGLIGVAAFAQGEAEWPTFHGDAARTGFSSSPAPSTPNVLWQLTVGQIRELGTDGIETNWPIIYQNKVFLAGIEVRALDLKTGKILWRYHDQETPFFPHGLAASNGKLFVTVNDTDNLQTMKKGFVYALDAEQGQFLWKAQLAKDASHSLPLVVEGKVFVGDDSGTLNALDCESGKILWQKKLVGDGEIHASLACADGLIFIGTEGDARYTTSPKNPSSVFALSLSKGEVVWQFPIDYTPSGTNLIHSTPAVSNGVVYVGSENGWFYALTAANGNLVWKKKLADEGRSMVGPSAAAGLGYGKVFVSIWAGKFLALDQKTGETIW
ncbi:MAG: PQQ-binding-like beta-propeller repeat protein, partial [Candidatus Cloacimonetes bacterium]|nr:PQQ-binding-like beta-propeller repeat protein [Candidatus Cloacimonadota bacterium]